MQAQDPSGPICQNNQTQIIDEAMEVSFESSFTSYYSNIIDYITEANIIDYMFPIEFEFHYMFNPSIKILIHYIFKNNNRLYNFIYKHNYTIIISVY